LRKNLFFNAGMKCPDFETTSERPNVNRMHSSKLKEFAGAFNP